MGGEWGGVLVADNFPCPPHGMARGGEVKVAKGGYREASAPPHTSHHSVHEHTARQGEQKGPLPLPTCTSLAKMWNC
jgi:hypothetical protein